MQTACPALLALLALPLLAPSPAQADPWARALAVQTGTSLDESLSRAARRHAQDIAARPEAPPTDIRAAITREGLADAQLATFAAVGDGSALQASADRFAQARAAVLGPTRLGVGRAPLADGRQALVVVWSRRLIELPPLGASARPASLALAGTLLGGQRPRAFLTRPAGDVIELEVQREGRRVALEVPLDQGRGTWDLELLVDTDRGPEVGALWRFAVGVPPLARAAVPSLGSTEALRAAIDALRRSFGRAPTAPSPTLTAAAAGHAARVCATGRAAHVIDGKSPQVRAEAVGWRGPIAENVAIAPSLGAAHAELLASPSHRLNLLLPEARALGVGVARAGDRVCVVELFGLAGP